MSNIKDIVQEKYAETARRVLEGKGLPADCCTTTSCCSGAAAASCDPITSDTWSVTWESVFPRPSKKPSKYSLWAGTFVNIHQSPSY